MTTPTVLLADDDRGIRTVVSHALSRAGMEVRSTGNAALARREVVAKLVHEDENAEDNDERHDRARQDRQKLQHVIPLVGQSVRRFLSFGMYCEALSRAHSGVQLHSRPPLARPFLARPSLARPSCAARQAPHQDAGYEGAGCKPAGEGLGEASHGGQGREVLHFRTCCSPPAPMPCHGAWQ